MRRIRFSVAMSLDGYIAGPHGEVDWIVMDPDIDFREIFDQFDTILVGRRTFESMPGAGDTSGQSMFGDMRIFVFSHTLQQQDYPDVMIVRDDIGALVASLKKEAGKDIWLFGGGSLFKSFLAAGLVDTVEVAVIPFLLGEGVPLLPSPATQAALTLTNQRTYDKTGVVALEYTVNKN